MGCSTSSQTTWCTQSTGTRNTLLPCMFTIRGAFVIGGGPRLLVIQLRALARVHQPDHHAVGHLRKSSVGRVSVCRSGGGAHTFWPKHRRLLAFDRGRSVDTLTANRPNSGAAS